MNYYLRRPVLAAIFASTACMASIPTASAGPFTDWLFGPFRQQPAVPVGAPQYVGPPLTGIPQTQAAWLPPAGYSTQWNRAAVTNYRPVASLDPATGTTVTRMMPCTSYELQAQRIPMLSLRPALGGYSYPQATRWPSLTSPYAGATPVPSSVPTNATSLNMVPSYGLQSPATVQSNYAPYTAYSPTTVAPYANGLPATQYAPSTPYYGSFPSTASVPNGYPVVQGATQATALMPTINMQNRPWPNYTPAPAETSIPTGSMFPIPAYSQPGTVPYQSAPTNSIPAYPQTAYYSQPVLAPQTMTYSPSNVGVPQSNYGTTPSWSNSGAPSYSTYGSVMPTAPAPYGSSSAGDWGYGPVVPAPGLQAPLTNEWQPTTETDSAFGGTFGAGEATQQDSQPSTSNIDDPESMKRPSLPRNREAEGAQGASLNRFPLRNLTRETMASESTPPNDSRPVAPDLLPSQSVPNDLHPIPAPKNFPEPKWNPGLLDVRDRTASTEPPIRKAVETFAVYQEPTHETFKPIQWTSAEIDVRRSDSTPVRPANAVRLRPSTEK